jgi:hypothetical protein
LRGDGGGLLKKAYQLCYKHFPRENYDNKRMIDYKVELSQVLLVELIYQIILRNLLQEK